MSYIRSFIGWLYLSRRGAGPWSSRALAAHWTQPGLCVWVCVCRGTLDALPSLGVGELVPARAEPRPPTHFIQPIRWLSYDAMLLLLTLPWTAVGRITNYPWSFATYIPFNFHLHVWKPHCSDRATAITSGPNCCSAGTSTTNVNTTTRKYFVKYTAKLMSEIERERDRRTPSTPASDAHIYRERRTALGHSQASVSFPGDTGYLPERDGNNKPPSGGFIILLWGKSVSKDYALPTWHGNPALASVVRNCWESFDSV